MLGSAEVRKVFNMARIGCIAGCYVTDGIVKRGAFGRLLRNGTAIFKEKIKSLKRERDELKEAKQGYECGILFESASDIQEGDVIQIFEEVRESHKLL